MDINVPFFNQDDRVGWGAWLRGCVAALSEARIDVIFVVDVDSDVTESLASRRQAPVLGGDDQIVAVLGRLDSCSVCKSILNLGTELTEKGYKLADDRFNPHPPFNDIDFLIGCDQMWRVMTKDVELWPDILAATKNVFGCGTIQPSTNKTNKIEEEQKKKKE